MRERRESKRERAAGKSSRNAQRVTAAVGYANGKVAICSRWLLYTGPRCGYHFTVPLFSSILSHPRAVVGILPLSRSLAPDRPSNPPVAPPTYQHQDNLICPPVHGGINRIQRLVSLAATAAAAALFVASISWKLHWLPRAVFSLECLCVRARAYIHSRILTSV